MTSDVSIPSLKDKIDDLNLQAWNMKVNDSPKAFELCKEAIALGRSINYTQGIADGLRVLGFCYARLSKNHEAQAALQEALSLFEKLKDLKGQAAVYEYLGIIQRNWGNFGKALEFLMKALSLSRQTGFSENETSNNYQIGVTYKHLGDFEKALDYLYAGQALAKEIKRPLYASYSINVIGSIYFENGDYEHALEYFQQGLVARQESGDKWGEAGSLDNIGFTFFKLNKYEEAIKYCKQSLAISTGTDDKRGQANAMLHLAEIYKQTNNIEQATKFSHESLSIRKTSGDKRGEAEILLFLADLYKTHSSTDEKIIECLASTLKIAEEINAVDLLSKTRFHLYEYYKQKGNYEEALKSLDLHTSLEKEFHKNTIDQKVKSLEISHKAEEIKKEAETERLRNKELMELNEQIEKANAELRIESSLERVRTAAMAMNKPDDMLEVCKIISHELASLEVKEIRNIQTAIFYEEKGAYMNYEYYAKHDKQLITEVLYNDHPVAEKFANQMLKGANEIFMHGFKGQEVRDWLNYQKTTNVFIDTFLESAGSLNYYWYSLGPVALGISTYAPLNEEEIELFKRFRNVFELAYRRYLDIEKALAQAREAQIEAALEKVRSNTMGMRSSEDLANVATVMFDQMRILGGDLFSFGIVLCDKHENMVEQWHSIPHAGMLAPFLVPVDLDHIHRYRYDQWKAGVELFSVVIPADYIARHFELMLELPSVKAVWAGIAAKGIPLPPIPSWEIDYGASFKYGYLLVSALQLFKEQKIFSRFANVFEQAYTRFLDLQKAEMQAREAQIETALERIRARAMAMHSSDELVEVANILREQMGLLGQSELETSVVNLYDVETGLIHNWNAFRQPGLTSGPIKTSVSSFPGNASELTREMVSMYQSGKKEFTLSASGSKLMEFFEVLVTSDPQVANYTGRYIPEKVFYHFTAFTGGTLLTVSYQPPNEDVKSLQRRAASVFDMAYRRYLDLKRAEANAREAQIEAALEKVRSRSLAMHKSDELNEVIIVVLKKLQEVGISMGNRSAAIFTFKPGSKDYYQWAASPELSSAFSLLTPYIDHPVQNDIWNARQMQVDFFTRSYTREEKNSFFQYLFDNTELQHMSKEEKDWALSQENYDVSIGFEKNSAVAIVSHSGKLLSDDENEVLKRFSRVFEQSYIRFLDLQKAEAQAREAQIEASLERVRSRSMAMHKSDELPEAANLLFRQIESLGIHVFSTGYNIWQDDKKAVISWMSSQGLIQRPFKLPLTVEPALIECYEAASRGDTFYVQELSGDKLISHLGYMRTLPGVDQLMGQMSEAGISLPHRMINHHVFFLQGYLLFITYDPVPDAHEIFRRFAKVFEQTYTRFLDLQKAEAQAREAQIEAALERVRSRSMAMHKSDELLEVVASVFQQMQLLGFNLNLCNIVLFDNKTLGADYWASGITQAILPESYHVPYADHPLYNYQLNTWKNAEPFAVFELGGELKKSWDEILFTKTDLQRLPESTKKMMQQLDKVILSSVATKHGLVQAIGTEHLSNDDVSILSRFAKVFDQTYTRFLDLQKAEAQAKEAQIEAALERVRSRSMGMQKSEELREVGNEIYKQLIQLNFNIEGDGFILDYPGTDDLYLWGSDRWGAAPDIIHYPYLNHPYFNQYKEAKEKGLDFLIITNSFEEKNTLFDHFFKYLPGYKPEIKEIIYASPGLVTAHVFLKNVVLFVWNMSGTSYSETENAILMRFGKVFEQAYIRFKDLEQAEAQARDAQIEAALEKVRAKVMAMKSSADLNETSLVFGEQLRKLGIDWQFSYFWLIEEDKDDNTFWITWPDNQTSTTTYSLAEADESFRECIIAWRNQEKIHGTHVPSEDVQGWLDTFDRITRDAGGAAIEIMKAGNFKDGVYYYDAMIKFGSFGILMNRTTTDEEKNIQSRFAVEFERAYTRFLDLKKAEAQAREAQIQLALERVRARTMAMHKSDELGDAAVLLYKELKSLGVTSFLNCGYVEIDEERNIQHGWMTKTDGSLLEGYTIPLTGDQVLQQRYEAWKQKDPVFSQRVAGEELKKHTEFTSPHLGSKEVDEMVKTQFPDPTIYYCGNFSHGYLHLITGTFLHAEEEVILARFTRVFEMTYKRFLDLQKAEAQAREAQIEASLERVRSRTMAMHKSEEVTGIAVSLNGELLKLGFEGGSTIIIIDKKTGDTEQWTGFSEDKSLKSCYVPHFNHPYAEAVLNAWKTGEKFLVYTVAGDEKKLLDDHYFSTGYKDFPDNDKKWMRAMESVTFSHAFMKYGAIHWGPDHLTEEQLRILQRFAKVFEQSYTRFLDLKRAEAQAREALVEAALERVRARALAMQQPEELRDVAQVLRNEMGALGVEELETSSIYIHGESSENVECWYALQDPKRTEKKMVSDHFLLNLNETWVGREMKKFYSSREKQTSIVMQGANRKEWIGYCYKHSPAFSGFYGETIPDRTYHLYKFSHGYIGAAAPGDISTESWKLLSRAASVFSLAYSRFKDLSQARSDLIKLKEEKKRAEDALAELQNTQKQLIQTEKMASLGELTAGIAHEIQNPLNFVNNFSDVSNELIEEMKEELRSGNTDGAIQIANYVKENLGKILHHGKRADGIVKGMLQHSRTSSGTKEPTDINNLADEYLRLAYHGFRAKDKSFSAKFETNFDSNIEKINVVPQDIGRVILNLINNAFYTVNEKKKRLDNGYDPIVTVTTKKIKDKIEISVKDNGNGIPQKALDKIFQPFFTTKPTGQGTGLGLSLSYDIITKGHHGEIKVDTKEGDGCEFTISLPVN